MRKGNKIMMFFKNLSIRFKILIPVTILGILMVILGLTSLNSANQIMNASEEISGSGVQNLERLDEIAISYQSLRRVAFAHIVENDASRKKTLQSEADSLKKQIENTCDEYEKMITSDDTAQSFQQFP